MVAAFSFRSYLWENRGFRVKSLKTVLLETFGSKVLESFIGGLPWKDSSGSRNRFLAFVGDCWWQISFISL